MHNSTIYNRYILANSLLFTVFLVVTFRNALHFMIYDFGVHKYYFKFSILFVFICLVACLLIKNKINLKPVDYIFLNLGAIFVIYNTIFHDFRGAVNSVFYFLGVYLFLPHFNYYKIFHKFFIFSTLIISIEIIIEFFIFNGHFFGLNLDVIGSYRAFATKFNPDNLNLATVIGDIYRLEGIFGNHQLTGSFLAVSASYFYGYSSNKKYAFILLINVIALILTLSTISILSFILAITMLSILSLNKSKLFTTFVVILIVFNIKLVELMIERLIINSSNIRYVKSFLFYNYDLSLFITGFNNHKSFENDLSEMFYYFGIIPSLLVLIRYIYPVIANRSILFNDQIFTSCSSAVIAGVFTLIHQGGVIGWHIGLHFLFMFAVLLNYSTHINFNTYENIIKWKLLSKESSNYTIIWYYRRLIKLLPTNNSKISKVL